MSLQAGYTFLVSLIKHLCGNFGAPLTLLLGIKYGDILRPPDLSSSGLNTVSFSLLSNKPSTLQAGVGV